MAKTYNNNSTYWEKRAVGRMTKAEQYSEANITRIYKVYDKANKDIDKMIDNVYANYSKQTGLDKQALKKLLSKNQTDKFWKTLEGKGLKQYVKNNYKARITRLEKLKGDLYAKVKEITPKETIIDTQTFTDVMNNTYNSSIYDTIKGTGKNIEFNTLDTPTIDQVLGYQWSGANYSERIWNNTDILANQMGDIISKAVMTGASLSRTSKEIQDAFGVGKYYADRLIRTETNHFHNEAEYQAYTEMGVEEYVFVAVLDSRTSTICQEHDGKVYKMSKKVEGENYPPLHPNCRSTTRAWFGKEFAPTKRRVNGEVIDYVTYKEYEKNNLANFDTLISKNNIISNKKGVLKTKYGVNYDLKSLKWLHKDMQTPIINQINELTTKYPIITSNLNEHKGLTLLDGIDKTKPNSKGYTTRDNKKLFLSSKFVGNRSKYISDLKNEIKSGFKMDILPKNYEKYTITHEFGHVLENAILKSNPKLDYSNIKYGIIDIAQKQTGKTSEEILKYLSQYGSRNNAEFFAEVFTSLELGNGKNPLSIAMAEYLKGVM